jgi:hypothetical protein
MRYELSPRDLRHKERIDDWNRGGKARSAARIRDAKIAAVERCLDPPPPPQPGVPTWFYTNTYPRYGGPVTWNGCTVWIDPAPVEEKKDLSFHDVVDKLRKGEPLGRL